MRGARRARGRRQMSVGVLAGLGAVAAGLVVATAQHPRLTATDAGAVPAFTRDVRAMPTPLFREPARSFGALPTPTLAPAAPAAAPAVDSGVLALRSAHPYPGHPLRYGSHGPAVREIQQALGITVDGWFGSETEHAVREFQDTHDLEVDGVVGPITWHALFS